MEYRLLCDRGETGITSFFKIQFGTNPSKQGSRAQFVSIFSFIHIFISMSIVYNPLYLYYLSISKIYIMYTYYMYTDRYISIFLLPLFEISIIVLYVLLPTSQYLDIFLCNLMVYVLLSLIKLWHHHIKGTFCLFSQYCNNQYSDLHMCKALYRSCVCWGAELMGHDKTISLSSKGKSLRNEEEHQHRFKEEFY